MKTQVTVSIEENLLARARQQPRGFISASAELGISQNLPPEQGEKGQQAFENNNVIPQDETEMFLLNEEWADLRKKHGKIADEIYKSTKEELIKNTIGNALKPFYKNKKWLRMAVDGIYKKVSPKPPSKKVKK